MKRLAIYGGSFDPPGIHRREIARRLSQLVDEVIVVPCGPRPAEDITHDTIPIHRAVMTDMTFRGLPRVRVELFDLEADHFTPPSGLEECFRHEGDISHVVAAEFVKGGRNDESAIQQKWTEGRELWENAKFIVLRQEGEEFDERDLPPRSQVLDVPRYDPTGTIRNRVFQRESIEGLVVPEVASYIVRHRLYRSSLPARESNFRLARPRFKLFVADRNEKAAELAKQFEPYVSDDPEMIVVMGGDGTMLHAIRQTWRERLPYYGLNLGHVGFLLNEADVIDFWQHELLMYQLPLLWVGVELLNGQRHQRLAFNDAWVERATGQTAWLRLGVNGEVRLSKVMADGMLISTAAGSTSYARAMGATPLPFNTRVLMLVGSNVLEPRNWQPAVMPIDSEIEITTLDPEKRPLEAYVDGVAQGKVKALRVRVSHIAAVELAFRPGHDPASKLAEHQFSE